ncbi:MAG TPA: TrkH family potassium uptake protein [Pyrinomonadaceae bacterium]|nr:TrkH family potassium uptake protein [Pyrinomonadaceae bacterium]
MIKRFIRRNFQPAQLVVLSFASVIVLGTILLSLPISTQSREGLRIIDAFFTAVSATCVTGLIVVDTGTVFSAFGQIVILTCIQIGGLGLMTFTTVFLVFTGRRLAIADSIAIQESFTQTPTGKLKTLVKYIILASFTIEAIGAFLLTIHWYWSGRFASLGETVYHAVFHSVSAFCNAGFALYADSLMGFQSDTPTILIMSTLIIVGGLGFLVGLDVKEYVQMRLFYRFWAQRVKERVDTIRSVPRLSLHTKLVLITTFALLVIGTVSYFILERRELFAEMSLGIAWLNAFFCSVTARTAGFNAIDFAGMGASGLLCTMVLMFIGASPGSTGGGVKTSTFGLLVAYSLTRWRGFINLNIFNRTIAPESIDKAGAVVVSAIALIILAGSFLMASETLRLQPEASHTAFVGIIFETISAFATVGLSLGQTPLLTDPGKLMISVVMFIGRTGPLTLALAISRRRRRTQFRYAEENVMIG